MKRSVVVFLFIPFSIVAQHGLISPKAMVVSAREEASQIGADIMEQGGNAFDAMIATQLALAVAYPYAGNLGGGGFMVYRLANGDTGTLDFRETAPMAATKNMYLDTDGNVIAGKSTESGLAIGVPGTVAGIFEIYAKFGSLPLQKLFAPAIALAEKGVVVTERQQGQIDTYRTAIIALSGANTLYAHGYKAGDTIKYPALAETLKRICKNGRSEFYEGQTAQKLAGFITLNAGIVTLSDLSSYEAKWRKPMTFDYKNFTIITMGPPASGGICLAQILKMIEPYKPGKIGQNSVKYMQLLIEAERRSFADRNYFLGDPDFIKIPVNQLISKDYLSKRMKTFSFSKATKSSDVSHGKVAFSESNETTHFSIADSFGNAVAVTTTLNGAFGSKLYCDELGFFLNNEMDDFSSKPGEANYFGLTGSEANSIAPGKRMLSSMTPTIVEKDGKPFMILGSPGGSSIITSVLQTILNVAEFGMTMQQAVNAPRFHHQWLPDEVVVEPGRFSKELLDTLAAKGYIINEKTTPVIGKVDAVLFLPGGGKEGAADKRGDDAAAGF
jgi:gamma-glutamyltranspeptidase/glutathione hydrolase